MKETEELPLIAGIFKPSDARMILIDVLTSKIRFHQMNNLSSKERFGKEDSVAVQRIPVLRSCITKVREIVEHAEKENMMLEIHAQVVITYKEHPMIMKK